MEAEIQRKKEHQNFATNFAKSRGFVRTNWKSKNFNPADDPCAESSSTDESEVELRQAAENADKVDEEAFQRNKSLRLGIKPPSPDPVNELLDYS